MHKREKRFVMYFRKSATLILCGIILFILYMKVEGEGSDIEYALPGIENSDEGIGYETDFNVYDETVYTLTRTVKENINQYVYDFTEEEYDILARIVEAEAGGEDYKGRLLVANVVLNRVKDDGFPDNIKDVVYHRIRGRAQFSPVGSGRIERVIPSKTTLKAVEAALMGEDESKGALYFAARKYANEDSMSWFDRKLCFLFEHGGHEFFKEYKD